MSLLRLNLHQFMSSLKDYRSFGLVLALGVVLIRLDPLHAAHFVPTYAGPYTAYITKWYPCAANESDGGATVYMRASYYRPHFRTLQTVTGNITWRSEFNDSYWMRVKFDLWSNNQWKENALLLKFPIGGCKNMRNTFPNFFNAIFRAPKKPASAPCVVAPSTYSVKDSPIDWTSPPFPVLPYGNYRTTIWAGLKKTATMCSKVECVLSPK